MDRFEYCKEELLFFCIVPLIIDLYVMSCIDHTLSINIKLCVQIYTFYIYYCYYYLHFIYFPCQ